MLKRLVGIFLIVSAAAASQALVLDSFDDGLNQVQASGTGDASSVATGSSMVGGERELFLDLVYNPLGETSTGSANTADLGLLKYANGNETAYDFWLVYDGVGNGALDLDLSALSALQFNYLSSDLSHLILIDLVSFDGQGNIDGYAAGFAFTANLKLSPHSFVIGFDELFTPDGFNALDFSDVDLIGITFSNYVSDPTTEFLPANDFVLDSIEIVPEPATMFALATGLVALAARRKRK